MLGTTAIMDTWCHGEMARSVPLFPSRLSPDFRFPHHFPPFSCLSSTDISPPFSICHPPFPQCAPQVPRCLPTPAPFFPCYGASLVGVSAVSLDGGTCNPVFSWIVGLVCAGLGVLVIGCAIYAWFATRRMWQMRKNFSNDSVAERCAEAIARFDLEEVEWLNGLNKPNKIQQAFIQIVKMLEEVFIVPWAFASPALLVSSAFALSAARPGPYCSSASSYPSPSLPLFTA